ncbi:MAG: cupin domain-containing protein [Planctomycetota bacterium]
MARYVKQCGVIPVAIWMLLAAGCAKLETVEDAGGLAVQPEPASPAEEAKKKPDIVLEDIIPLKFLPEEKPVSYVTETVLKARPVDKDAEALRLMLSKIGSARVLLNQYNTDLAPRYYQGHDETIYVIKGHGILIIGEDRYVAKPGGVFVIPRNEVHSLINTGEKPFVALVVQTPPPLGGDMMPVREKKEQ